MSGARRPTTPTRPARPEPVALLVTERSGLRVSPEAFWRLCAVNRDLRLERTARGELIVMPPAGSETGHSNADLTGQLWGWSKVDGSGLSFDSSAGFTLPNGAVRAPDAAWIRRERWATVAPADRKEFAPIVPDFVVELRSPTDSLARLHKKMGEYIEQGVRLAWLLDVQGARVEVYRPGRAVEALERPVTLSGEDVLPGFVLDLRGILAE